MATAAKGTTAASPFFAQFGRARACMQRFLNPSRLSLFLRISFGPIQAIAFVDLLKLPTWIFVISVKRDLLMQFAVLELIECKSNKKRSLRSFFKMDKDWHVFCTF